MSLFSSADRPQRALFLTGVIGAAVAALFGLLAPHGGAAWQLPGELKQQVATSLLAAGLPGLEIEMQGQQTVLHGLVEDEGDILRARNAAATAAGPGGSWAGGVTSVNVADVRVGAFDRPYQWSVTKAESGIVLTGAAPGEHARAAISDAARAAFGSTQVTNGMHIAGGAASPAFTDVAIAAIQRVAALHTGEARIVDSQIVVIGDGDQASVDALHAAFADPPAPYRARLAVTIEGLDVDHPELQGLNLVNSNADTCERAFARLMEHNVINFAPNSASIDPSSRATLDALASVAVRCDRFPIEVAGHTDNDGGHEFNMQLSQRRADSVANYLASQGVDRARLTAHGYGPDRPRASNETETGQATNRRIEFNVSSQP